MSAIDLEGLNRVFVGETEIEKIYAGENQLWPYTEPIVIPPYDEAVLNDNPVAYYRLGEASGNFADSSTYNGPAGVPNARITHNQPSLLPNGAGRSVSVGTAVLPTGGEIIMANAAQTQIGNDAMTIEFWGCERTGAGGVNRNALAAIRFGITFGGRPGANTNAAFTTVTCTAAGEAWVATVSAVQPDTPFHLVFARSRTGNTRVLYLNGQRIGATDGGTGTWNNSGGFQLGTATANMSGRIEHQELALYNYALSDAQVAAHYQAAGG